MTSLRSLLAAALLAAGANVLDVGAESTHPDAEDVAVDEELRRLVPVVQTLLDHGADVAARDGAGKTPLDYADFAALREEVKTALREHGAKHSLFYAAEEGMVELVADLIKEGANVNEKNIVSLNRVLSASA